MVSTNGLSLTQSQENYSKPICLDIKYSLENDPPELTAREFCRRIHGLTELTEVEILQAELHPSYRKRCIRLLCQVLGVKRHTIYNWGPGVDFRKMPDSYQRFLGLSWERYELLAEVKRLRRFGC